MNEIDHLINLGLTLNEAKIYNALIKIKIGSIDKVSKETDIHRRNVYDTLLRLQQKGLVFQIINQKPILYSPVAPSKLTEFVEDKEDSLKIILPFLKKEYAKKLLEQNTAIYKGVGGLKNYIDLVLKENKNVYGVGSKGTWFDPRIYSFGAKAGKQYNSQTMQAFLIYDDEMRQHKDVINAVGKPYKFLPKKYSSSTSIDIFGEYIAIYSGINVKMFEKDITIFIFKDKILAQGVKKWFDFIWDMLP